MDSWADVEEAVTEAIYDAWQKQYRDYYLDWTDGRVLAQAAIRKIQELRLTAVVPDA
jgi:hypothetical protein